jgi:hypothetical protein
MHDFIVSIYFEPISKNHGRRGTGEWLASGVPLLNKIFCYLFRADFENPLWWRALMSPASTVVQGWRVGTRQQR